MVPASAPGICPCPCPSYIGVYEGKKRIKSLKSTKINPAGRFPPN